MYVCGLQPHKVYRYRCGTIRLSTVLLSNKQAEYIEIPHQITYFSVPCKYNNSKVVTQTTSLYSLNTHLVCVVGASCTGEGKRVVGTGGRDRPLELLEGVGPSA